MKLTIVATLAFMFALSSVGAALKKTFTTGVVIGEAPEGHAAGTQAEEPENKTIAIKWSGSKDAATDSKVFRIGNQRVCLVMGE